MSTEPASSQPRFGQLGVRRVGPGREEPVLAAQRDRLGERGRERDAQAVPDRVVDADGERARSAGRAGRCPRWRASSPYGPKRPLPDERARGDHVHRVSRRARSTRQATSTPSPWNSRSMTLAPSARAIATTTSAITISEPPAGRRRSRALADERAAADAAGPPVGERRGRPPARAAGRGRARATKTMTQRPFERGVVGLAERADDEDLEAVRGEPATMRPRPTAKVPSGTGASPCRPVAVRARHRSGAGPG